ncbi:LppU/SCO3897 family protein [Streptomyces sp. OZ13]|uniref:LppU/SCO3897 family protein n=1 Tax=Streptomyces sp. OZ13 TaxID=3452210 RepID=UPI003F89A7BC
MSTPPYGPGQAGYDATTQQHLYQAHTGAGPGGAVPCQVCGSLPAVHAVIRGHQGMFLVMRSRKREGFFCRSCGTSLHRRMTTDTLWQGWWGVMSLFITPVTVLMNLGPRSRFRRLAAPYGGWRPPLDPGRRVLARPPALLVLTPIVLMVVVLATGITTAAFDSGPAAASVRVGDCVRNHGTWPDQDIRRVDCGSHLAEYRTARLADCDGDELLMRLEYAADAEAMCLEPLGRG